MPFLGSEGVSKYESLCGGLLWSAVVLWSGFTDDTDIPAKPGVRTRTNLQQPMFDPICKCELLRLAAVSFIWVRLVRLVLGHLSPNN